MEILRALLRIDLNYVIIGVMVVFYSLEQLLPAKFTFNKRLQHLVQNLLFQVTFFSCNIFCAALVVSSIEWLDKHRVGVLHLLQVPLWSKLILSVVMFDFLNYWFHRRRTAYHWRGGITGCIIAIQQWMLLRILGRIQLN